MIIEYSSKDNIWIARGKVGTRYILAEANSRIEALLSWVEMAAEHVIERLGSKINVH